MTERKPFVMPEENLATLVLDGRWEGCEIDVNLSVGWDVYEAIDRWRADWDGLTDDGPRDVRLAALRVAADLFVVHALRGWNVTDSRGAVPPTTDGLMSIKDPAFMPSIVGAWLGALGTAPDPLANRSASEPIASAGF